MVILALLKSDGRTPLQWWTFREAKAISVGRSLSNQVIVRDSHVSRRHIELLPVTAESSSKEQLQNSALSQTTGGPVPSNSISASPQRWRIVSHGKNGTYLNGQLVQDAEVHDDDTIQLAPKGPQLKVYLRNRMPSRDRLPLSPKAVKPSGEGRVTARAAAKDIAAKGVAAKDAAAKDKEAQQKADPAQGRSKPAHEVAIPAEELAESAMPEQGTIPTGTFPPSFIPAVHPQQARPLAPLPPAKGLSEGLPGQLPSWQSLSPSASIKDKQLPSERSIRPSVASIQGTGPPPCDHQGNPSSNLLCSQCGQPLRVIRTVRQYQLLRLLGRGGMGTTYLAWRLLPDALSHPMAPGQRLVVIKQLNADVSRIAKASELFAREAAVLQRMDHPGIPHFLDAFSDGEQSYLVMDLVHGQNLEQVVLKQGPIEPSQAILWMQQTCDVLHHLHKQRPPIIHRDIKPANLLRQYRDKRIVVVDFGAVKSMVGATGTRIKAEGYTAPEQEAGQPTLASDLYSVGATLLFLLTGKNPLHFYTSAEALDLSKIDTISPELTQVLEKALAPDANDRYSSALELKLALGACLPLF